MGVTIDYKGQTISNMSASGTKILKTAGKYCEGDITVNYQSDSTPLPNYRKYEGTIDTDIVGTNEKALLATSDVIATHYTDSTFKVAVYFTPDPETAYAVLQTTGYNVANQEPYRASSSVDSMQYTYREGSSIGTFNSNAINLSVSDPYSASYVGRIICDAQGHLYVMSGSVNYGIRKGTYIAELSW